VIIVGIDPGSRNCGYSVINDSGVAVKIIEMGTWPLEKLGGKDLGDRLAKLMELSKELFKKHNPRFIGLEKAVAFKNVVSAFKLSEARGVIRAAAHTVLESAAERIIEISPTEVKRSASGMGLGSKGSIEKALRLRFPNSEVFVEGAKLNADAFDALAVAWSAKLKSRISSLKEVPSGINTRT